MELLVGLFIGIAIGATGVGGGTLAAPALILLLGFSPRTAVGTALVYAAAVKVWASVVYIFRGQVDFRVLRYLLYGGLPGVLLGAIVLEELDTAGADKWILCGIGLVVMVSAAASIINFRKLQRRSQPRLKLLSLFALPIGLESGFSSSGTGALGNVLLLQFSDLSPSTVVGTGLVFGIAVCGIGGAVHAFAGTCDWPALARMVPAGLAGSMIGVLISGALSTRALRNSVLFGAGAVGFSLLIRGMEAIL